MSITVENLRPTGRERRNYDSTGRRVEAGDRPFDPTRIYPNFVGESILDNLNNRRQRPNTILKPLVIKALEEAGIRYTKIRWSSKAGCRMCPCSPGWILEGHNGKDFWIDVTNDDTEYTERAIIGL